MDEQFDLETSDIVDDVDIPDISMEITAENGDIFIENETEETPIDTAEPETTTEENTADQRWTADATAPKTNENRLTQLPMSRIKSIMKIDPDVSVISHDCLFLVTKATELFIESLAKEAFNHTVNGKRKTVQKKDFDQAIENIDTLAFLEGSLNF